ncbi:MAG: microcystin LR degradation protein MlrC-like protein [Rhodospirillaceae bacterium]|nr:microcystin LR degradation protein MlrC-like protein [Rhodospirillaceae bacterium]|tara:strand:+ start:8442 stop:9914 length:1473 start_codon:yes stop_codon:yes gene_type:complete
MRIFAAGLGTETNTFAPFPTGERGFRQTEYFPSGTHPDSPTFSGAPLYAARQLTASGNHELVEGLCTFAEPAGVTTRQAYETLRDHILDELKAAMPVDIVAFSMHGAMIADGYDDCEGDMLARARTIVGPDVALGAELDLHCHFTPAMIEAADVIVAFKEYPHTDFYDRAVELLDLLTATARGDIRPVMSLADTGILDMIHTTREPARSLVDRLSALEGNDGVLSVSLGHGFPWGDVKDLGTRVLVVTDNRPDHGRELALSLASDVAAMRGTLDSGFMSIDEAYERVATAPSGPIVMADKSDNAGGGAPGDSTWMLQRALERQMTSVALGPLWDPIAVATCLDAGLGATLGLRIGGKMCPLSGAPVDLTVTVTGIAHDAYQTFGPGTSPLGDCVAVSGSGIDIVLNSLRTQAYGPELFTNVGIDPARRNVVIVKSTQHFYAGFAPIAAEVVYVGAPGVVAPAYHELTFNKAQRPRWPFDDDEPQIRLIAG